MEDDVILESPMNMAQESIIMTCSINIYRWFQNNIDFDRF